MIVALNCLCECLYVCEDITTLKCDCVFAAGFFKCVYVSICMWVCLYFCECHL